MIKSIAHHRSLSVLIMLVLLAAFIPVQTAQAAVVPTFSIVSFVSDTSVTIQTSNFPADQIFTVRMGAYGTLAIGGVEVATTNSGAGGAFQATYNIPDSLKGLDRIAIRMDSPAGYYAYNWFQNKGAATGGPVVSGYAGIPTFSIVNVVTDDKVKVRTNNFPANKEFTVKMGAYGTLAIGGVTVATTNSGAGGAFEAEYSIPDSLKGSAKIAVRMDSPEGYYAYNWFVNTSSTGGTGGPVSGYTGIPTFSIKSVDKDNTVTITTSNFPSGADFTVRMGAYGTAGVGGTVVATTNSGSGGAFEATYSIPDSLKGSAKIALRMESSAGYYAYNWFWNNTSATSGGTGGPVDSGTAYTGIPTFTISSVVRDGSVTVLTNNLPANVDFTVRMGAYGTAGIGGIEVATFNSGSGGSMSLTYNVPDALKGSAKIAIRMESTAGFFAYNWFWNTTTS